MNWNLPDIVNIVCLILMFSALVTASVKDVKRGEIPLFLFPICGSVCVILQLFTGVFSAENIFYGIFVFGLYFAMAYFFQGGGGDAILASILAFVTGREILNIILIAHLLFLLPSLYVKVKNKNTMLPFAPFMLVAFIIHYVYMFLVSY